ncbi:chaperone protein dnaJ 20, chloroplastic-like [Cornus florida]|uniref:chaperone protein dnaJ 20, chloroplastic-like n=1 Tax=Cornus florida TaxID=4283 RepID=UPI00289A04F9|nr:chaperone protein dnaJ 20, chloroplastic-like [Cornus florida]XP_059651241.1 chaperone protein dnaJ 20, chloroplastic-like [Cornus florida]
MCCSYRLISGSDSRFSLLPTQPTLLHARTSTPDPFLRLSFPTHFPKSSTLSVLTRVGSVRTKAAINDGFVTALGDVDMMSFYELLGISETGTMVEIKQAYKQLARKYHPDVSPPGRVEEYTRAFIRVQEAYETLSDPRSRALYDRDMAKGLHLAFSARRRYQSDEAIEERSTWKNCWQAQLSELKRRSMNKDTRGKMSWGARMRRQRNESN